MKDLAAMVREGRVGTPGYQRAFARAQALLRDDIRACDVTQQAAEMLNHDLQAGPPRPRAGRDRSRGC